MSIRATAILLGVLLAACADPTVRRVGSARYDALAPDAPVRVFLAESDAPQPFSVVAVIRTTSKDKSRTPVLEDVLPEIQAKARSVGADAVIVDSTGPVRSGILTTGITVAVRAIRLGPATDGIE